MFTIVKFSREHDRAKIPTRKYGDAGFDLYIDEKWLEDEHDGILEIKPGETVIVFCQEAAVKKLQELFRKSKLF